MKMTFPGGPSGPPGPPLLLSDKVPLPHRPGGAVRAGGSTVRTSNCRMVAYEPSNQTPASHDLVQGAWVSHEVVDRSCFEMAVMPFTVRTRFYKNLILGSPIAFSGLESLGDRFLLS